MVDVLTRLQLIAPDAVKVPANGLKEKLAQYAGYSIRTSDEQHAFQRQVDATSLRVELQEAMSADLSPERPDNEVDVL